MDSLDDGGIRRNADKDVAIFSPDRKYRYKLRRPTMFGEGQCLFIMLNPSTADETTNDNTVTRCIYSSKEWGFQELIVANLFAYRATYRKDMKKQIDPVGPDNDEWIHALAQQADRIVLAWGEDGGHQGRSDYVVNELLDVANQPIFHFGLTKSGEPRHPLYLSKKIILIPWERE